MRTCSSRVARPPILFGARSLAGIMLAVCEVGLGERQRGRCVGSGIWRWIEVDVPTITLRSPPNFRASKREVRHARQHAMSGHDDGCYAFGVSSLEVEALVRFHDGDRASTLLLEAFKDAVAEVLRGCQPWSRELAGDALEAQVYRRVTPSRVESKKVGSTLRRVPSPP